MKNILEGKKVPLIERVNSKFIKRASCGCVEKKEIDIEELKNKNKKIQFQYLYSEKLLRMISYMGQELNSVYSIQEMRGYIDRNLDLLGVKNFCILSFIETNQSFSKYVYPKPLDISSMLLKPVSLSNSAISFLICSFILFKIL